jgi:predicted transcriptional regulator
MKKKNLVDMNEEKKKFSSCFYLKVFKLKKKFNLIFIKKMKKKKKKKLNQYIL